MKKGCLWTSKHDCRLCAANCAVREHDYDPKQAMEEFAIPALRKRDEIDDWIEKECNYRMGCCSSIEELKYSVAREVAEKLWNVKSDGKELLHVLNKGVEIGKRETIEKALAFLNNKFYFNNLFYGVVSTDFNSMEEMFEDFKKAMMEE